jgi:DNA-binding SARP family transcriptional activator/predicted ATPase
MGELNLGVLGGFRLERADGRPVALPTKKTKALLAYLVLNGGQPQSRAKLATLLWEDSDEPRARESLRQTLSLLRKALSPAHAGALIAREDAVAFETGALAVDVIEFKRLVASGEPAQLDKAAQLYRGEFLEGFDLRASEFESWLGMERQRLKEKALAALEKLLAHHVASNGIEPGITIATRLLSLDPLRESAHRSLMEFYRKQGRHAAALRQYRICAEALKKELGVEPDAATRALYREIREQRNNPWNGTTSPALEEPRQTDATVERALPPVPHAVERRHMTVLGCDLVGLSALSARLDPEELHTVVAAYERCCGEVVSRFGGMVQKFSGDGMVACFGYPQANEHDPERAIRAGLALVETLPRLNDGLAARVHARVGIATGPVVVGDLAGHGAELPPGLLGEAPRLAALLQSLAEPDAVVIAASTHDLVRGLFEYRAAAPVTLAGSSEPIRIWRVIGESSDEIRFEAFHGTALTPFVGREAEVGQLLQHWQEARAGEGRIVLISGEPGIGKSRLVRVVQERLASEPHMRLRYQCSPFHTNSALYPFIQQLERAASFQPEDTPGQRLDKLEAVLMLGTHRVAPVAPLIASLLSIAFDGRYPALELSPVQQRRQTLAALLDQLEGLARKQPVLQVFEDAQWVDATSRELIDLGVERIRQLPVLLLITFRPEFEPPWLGLPNVSTLGLGRLERPHVQAIAEQVTGSRRLPSQVIEQIIVRTDGVPLFVEELTKTVLDAGILVEGAEGYRVEGPLPSMAVPTTLYDSLMARLDRLAGAKEIAQTAAAIGREFSHAMLSSVIGPDGPGLNEALVRLEQAELVFRKGEPPDAAYTFKHALLRDIAYESLPRSRRLALHQRIAENIRDHFPTIAETSPEVVAHHFTQAELAEPAVEWWGKAGTLALRRSAFVEAIAHFEEALSLSEKLAGGPAQRLLRLKLHVDYGQALIAARGYGAPETAAAFARARELADAVQDDDASFSVNYGLWVGSYVRGELTSMRQWADAFRHDAERHPDSPEVGLAWRMCGQTSWFQGDFVEARAHLEKALAAYNPERDRDIDFRFGFDPVATAKSYLACVLWPLGQVTEARLLAKDAIARAMQSRHIPTIANTQGFKCLFDMICDNPARTIQHAEILIALSREHDLRFYLAWGMFNLGWACWHGGERGPGLTRMGKGIAGLREQGLSVHMPVIEMRLAEAVAEAGNVETGLAILEEQIDDVARTGQRSMESEMYRLRGQILLRRKPADHAAAEASFRRAIEIAQSQQTRSFELRAALALAKLYRATGRDKALPDLLAPALAYFSKDAELPELDEAHRLLDLIAASSRNVRRRPQASRSRNALTRNPRRH